MLCKDRRLNTSETSVKVVDLVLQLCVAHSLLNFVRTKITIKRIKTYSLPQLVLARDSALGKIGFQGN
mgnify:CR=1 FL=1